MLSGNFLAWLRQRDEVQLAELLRRRPDVTMARPPRDLRQLASRLSSADSVETAVSGLDRNCQLVAQALQILGDGAVLADLTAISQNSPLLPTALDRLGQFGLVWLCGDTDGEPHLHIPEGLAGLWEVPLGLGPPAQRLFEMASTSTLRAICRILTITPGRTRASAVEAIIELFQEPEKVTSIVARLPRQARLLAQELAADSPMVETESLTSWFSKPSTEVQALLDHGFLAATPLPGIAIMPLEVCLALRGELSIELTTPPSLDRRPAPAGIAFADTGAGAAMATVDAVERLITYAGERPIAELKTGGVGKQQLRRLATALNTTEELLTFWLDLAWQAQLLARGDDDDGLMPTHEADQWLVELPAERWARLVRAWRTLPHTPLWRYDEERWISAEEPGKQVPPPCPVTSSGPALRAAILATVSDASDGVGHDSGNDASRDASQDQASTAITAPSTLLAAIEWRHPALLPETGIAREHCGAVLREAQLLGIMASGVFTKLGRAFYSANVLTHRDSPASDELVEAARAVLPAPVTAITLQADLTAMVAGPPSPEVTRLLDSAAVLETTGAARTWRFSPESVRRAFDTGATAESLLRELSGLASAGMPQPLKYLINDVARKHGRLRVSELASCICSEDTALLTELAHNRELVALRLRSLAPTVLASAESAQTTLRRLRRAGYAPVSESETGSVTVERPSVRRTVSEPESTARVPVTFFTAVDMEALTKKLLAAPIEPEPRQPTEGRVDSRGAISNTTNESKELLNQIASFASQLSVGEQRALKDAVEIGESVVLHYTSKGGKTTVRGVSELAIDDRYLVGWCHLRQDQRVFLLSHIEEVLPMRD